MNKFTKLLTTAVIAMTALTAGAGVAHAGQQTYTSSVDSNSSQTWTFDLRGSEPVRIVLRGDGDTDLDLFVRDTNNFSIAKAEGTTDREAVRFTPAYDGQFKVTVKNLGGVYNEYRLIVYTGNSAAVLAPNVLNSPTPNVLRVSN